MEGLLAIIAIVGAIMRVVNQSKNVKKNAPGQAAAPAKPAAPAQPRVTPAKPAEPTVQPARPTVQPTVAGGQETFWKQISETLKEEFSELADGGEPAKQPQPGHGAVGSMAEGDSRECEHGSVGGSMAYESHQGDHAVNQSKPEKPAPKKHEPRKPTGDALYQPALTAQEMRRAVVMAEILKRPQDRMAEQARRWGVR